MIVGAFYTYGIVINTIHREAGDMNMPEYLYEEMDRLSTEPQQVPSVIYTPRHSHLHWYLITAVAGTIGYYVGRRAGQNECNND